MFQSSDYYASCVFRMPVRLKISQLIWNLLWVSEETLNSCSVPTGWEISPLLLALYDKFLPFLKMIIEIISLIFWVTSNIFKGRKKEALLFRLLENFPWTTANANHNLTGKPGTCFSFCQRKSWDLPSWSYQARQICRLVQRILFCLVGLVCVGFFFSLGKQNIFPLLLHPSSKFGWFADEEASDLLDISASISNSLNTSVFSEIHINTFHQLPSQPVWRSKPETWKHCTRYHACFCIVSFSHSDSLSTVI